MLNESRMVRTKKRPGMVRRDALLKGDVESARCNPGPNEENATWRTKEMFAKRCMALHGPIRRDF